MILYYAVGGGLGHLTRARRVLEALRLDATIVTASPYARDQRVTGGHPVIEIPAHLERDPAAHRAWMRELVRSADRLIADTFPGGIQGELCGLEGLRLDYVARLLRWDEYRRAVPDQLPHFDTTYVIEELTHDVWSAAAALPLSKRRLCRRTPKDGPTLIVHSGPGHEVEELIAYARDLDPHAQILVATQADVPNRIDAYPVTHLFPTAKRIVSAAGFNVMLETEPFRHKHHVVPFPRRFDDQFLRAARRRRRMGDAGAGFQGFSTVAGTSSVATSVSSAAGASSRRSTEATRYSEDSAAANPGPQGSPERIQVPV